jgi:hypothetical protein
MQRIAKAVQFLANVNRNEKELRVMQIMPCLENPGNRQFFGQDDFAQFVDRLPLILRLGFFQFLYAIENFAKISRRIDRQLVADIDLELARQLDPHERRVSVEIVRAFLQEFLEWHHFLFLRGIDAANERRQPLVLKFDNHRTLHIRRGADDAGSISHFHCEIAPIAQDVLRADENVGVEIDHLLPQLAVEAGHDGDDEDEDHYPKHHAHHGDQRNDGHKRALRLQVAQGEKKAERKFQSRRKVLACKAKRCKEQGGVNL